MKKNYIYIIIVALLAAGGAYAIFSKPKAKVPELLARDITIAGSSEWLNTKKAIEALQYELRQNPKNIKAKLALAQAFIQEARETGKYAYYNAAALELIEEVLKKEPENYEALCANAAILLNQHHFADALIVGEKAIKINPYNGYAFGILCDASVELGNYPKAIEYGDKMAQIRPDLKSYSRISYLREVMGDNAGAIEAMKMAINAGYPGLEQTAWVRYQTGKLYENIGDTTNASFQYRAAAAERPLFAYSQAGLGSIALKAKDYKKAIIQYQKAYTLLPDMGFKEELAKAYFLNNDTKNGNEIAEEVIEALTPNSEISEDESGHGHYADLELSKIYLLKKDYNNALKHAKLEQSRRPENNEVNAQLAQVYFLQNNTAEATKYMDKALRTNSQNTEWLANAAMIYASSNPEKAKTIAAKILLLKTKTIANK